jgi:replicative DNA helicase
MIEKKIIDCIRIESKVMDTVIDMIKPQMFYDIDNRNVYEVMISLYSQEQPIDDITVQRELLRQGRKMQALTEIELYSSAKVENYCKLLIEIWMKKELEKFLKNAIGKVEHSDPFDLLDEFTETIYKIENHLELMETDTTLWQDYEWLMNNIRSKMKGEDYGLATPTLPTLTKATGGILKDYVVIYGQYKQGKTTLAEQIMLDIAFQKKAVGIINLEMSKESLYLKALSLRTGIDYLKLRNPRGMRLTEDELDQFDKKVKKKFEGTKIYVADKLFDIDRILSKMKIWKKKFGIELFIVDYLGLIESNAKYKQRYLEVASYSRMLKNAVKKLDTPIIALSQANDDNKTADSKAPARDADFVISVMKPKEAGIDELKVNDTSFKFDENHFLVTLENSRHGRNKQNFVCGFVNNNFVEIDVTNSLAAGFNSQEMDTRFEKPIKSYYETEEVD